MDNLLRGIALLGLLVVGVWVLIQILPPILHGAWIALVWLFFLPAKIIRLQRDHMNPPQNNPPTEAWRRAARDNDFGTGEL